MTAAASHIPARIEARRELLLVALLTAVGGILRLWAPQRLGLVHFDEGIYALAGLWPFSKGGLAAIDPTVIAYAPGGFPFLVGMSYLLLGVSDLAAIMVSVAAGTLTIPAAAWLARRSFGPGAGAAAAVLVSLSAFHVQYSRMALTDASFLMAWVFGTICGQRFLERPAPLTALALGASTGLAQLLKYNGWLVGAAVLAAAFLGPLLDPGERERARLVSTWGYGLMAALVAALVYWPWFRFVQVHGGYAKLMAHHRSYVGGPDTWLPHFRLQVDQMAALAGGPAWAAMGTLAALFAAWSVIAGGARARIRRLGSSVALSASSAALPQFWWLAGLWISLALAGRGQGGRLLAVSSIGLLLSTPFYHPYSRLWLPLAMLGWIGMAGLISFLLSPDGQPSLRDVALVRPVAWIGWFLIWSLLILTPGRPPRLFPGPGENPTPLAASDSLRSAVRQVGLDVPKKVPGLRLLVRPPVTFYLGGRLAVQTEPDVSHLMNAGPPGFWALVDRAQYPPGSDPNNALSLLLDRWEVVEEYHTTLNLPTLLDVDPGAARLGRSEASKAPLLLLRPRNKRPEL